jgi:mannose/cellobiose epimerase-like protein (N-acyl-D-glucosamine 2-epimerase family)
VVRPGTETRPERDARPGTEVWRRDQAEQLLSFGRGSALPGGGFGWLTDQGTIDPSQPRPLFLTARMTYVYALAFLNSADPADRRLAVCGLHSLSAEYDDREHGGWYASLDQHGKVNDTTKANYAHAHVLLASATAVAAGIPEASAILEAAADVISTRFWSDADGCAVEDWDLTFSELEPYRGANSNMHSVEAYLVGGDVTGDAQWHARALSIADRIINVHARANDWYIPEHYDPSWKALPTFNQDHPDDKFRPFGTTPGHSFEWARLLVTLESALADPPAWLLEAAVGLFDAAVRFGWAADSRPGFVYTLDLDQRPVVAQRLHWVVCEAVLAADSLARRTGQARYAEYADEWWHHIADHFLDPVNGGWWQELGPSLHPSTTIWSGKPDVYHSYQALLFPSLPIAPCAAVWLAGRGDS